MFIDIHTHTLTHDPKIKEIEVLDSRMPPGFGLGTGLFCYGLHPWHIGEVDEKIFFENLKSHLSNPKFFALGEIGVDRARVENLPEQKRLFEKQLEYAQRFKIGRIVIHSVRAYSDIFGPLKNLSHKPAILLHDFNANLQTAESFLSSMDCYFSFGARLFNLQSTGAKTFGQIPNDRVFLETDDQYDRTIFDIYQQAAKLKDIEPSLLQEQIQQNFQALCSR